MKTIYKYYFPIQDEFYLEVPYGAKILTVQMQHSEAQIWALVDTDSEDVRFRGFRVLGTGHPFPDADTYSQYVGTIQLHQGDLVFHVFTTPDEEAD